MTTRKPMPFQKGSSFSIDQWQDTEPVNVSWFDNSLLGPLAMSAIGALLVCCTALILPILGGSKSDEPKFSEPGLARKAKGDMPNDLTPLGREYYERYKDSPNAVSDLITEMIENEEIHSSFFREQLKLQGCNDGEMLRQLSTKLKGTKNVKQFERIVMVLDSMSSDIRNLSEMKTHIPGGLAVAGRHVSVAQLGKMHKFVPKLLLKTAQLPENADLLVKVALLDDQWNRQTLSKLTNLANEDAANLAVKIVAQHNGDPKRLSHLTNFESVCQFLWKGKLTGKKEFEDLWMGDSEASLKSFSRVVGSMIDEDPESVVRPVMSMFENRYITRSLLAEESIQKMDETISTKVEQYLSDTVEDESVEMAKLREKRGEPGPFAFLYLAKLLGGRETALEIARLAEENPAIQKKFKSIGDTLLAINEPETYDTLVDAWAIHGYSEKKQLLALKENVGQAIESNFLEQLRHELDQEKKDTRRMSAMIRAIEEIGTAESIPVLNKISNIRTSRLSGKARDAVYTIQEREKAEN